MTVDEVKKTNAATRKPVSSSVINLLFGLSFLILALISGIDASSVLSLMLFVIYALAMLKHDPCFVLKYAYLFYFCFAYVIGVAACEFSDIYLSELRAFSSFAGSLPLAVLSQWIFLTIICIFDNASTISKTNKDTIRISEKNRYIMSAIIVFGIMVEGFLLLRVIAHPAFLTGLDRFAYSIAYLGGIWSTCQSIVFYVLPVAALYLVNFTKCLPAAFFTVYAVYSFWTGNKFGAFFVAAYCVLLVLYPRISTLVRAGSSKVIKYVTIGILAILVVTASSQALVNGQSIQEVGDYFSSRCAQQGQIWWKMYENEQDSAFHFDEFKDELSEYPSYLTGATASYEVGIYKAMQMLNPLDFWGKVESGSRYTECGFAMALYYFGAPGVIVFASALGLGMSIVVNWFIYAASRNWIIESIILFRLFQKLCTTKSMFLFDDLLSPETIVLLVLLIALLAARRRRLSNMAEPSFDNSTSVANAVYTRNRHS